MIQFLSRVHPSRYMSAYLHKCKAWKHPRLQRVVSPETSSARSRCEKTQIGSQKTFFSEKRLPETSLRMDSHLQEGARRRGSAARRRRFVAKRHRSVARRRVFVIFCAESCLQQDPVFCTGRNELKYLCTSPIIYSLF